MAKVPLTVIGAEKLRHELHQLKTVERQAVIAAIAEARALIGKYAGDVAEVNAPGGIKEYEILDVRYE